MKRSASGVHGVVRWVLMALLASSLIACESPDDPEPTLEVEDLSGTITGTILDSDGDPIAGVQVHYTGSTSSGQTASVSSTTNAQGQFALEGVVVAGTQADRESPLTLYLQPPAGYLSGTVAVAPQAQVVGGIGNDQTIFLDDFNVDTGPVKLPALATTITGFLRDTGTGSPLSAQVSAEFIMVAFEQIDTTGIALTYGSASIEATVSDEDTGAFTLSGVVDDACIRVFVNGYSIDSLSGSAPPCLIDEVTDDPNALELKTNTSSITLANVYVTPYEVQDTVAPFVSRVIGVVDPSTNPAALNASITGESIDSGLRIVFSESMDFEPLPANVVLLLGSGAGITSQTPSGIVASGSDTLIVTTDDPLPAGTPVTVQFARGELMDRSGNLIALNGAIAYDEFAGGSNQYFELNLLTFEPSNAVADAPAPVSQLRSTVDTGDVAYVTTSALVDSVADGSEMIGAAATPSGGSVLYTNIIGTDPDDIEQLNSPGATEGLQALLDVVDDGARELFTDIARVSVVSSGNAADYLVSVVRGGTVLDVLFFPVATVDGNPVNAGPVSTGSTQYVIDANGATSFDLIVTGRPGTGVVLMDGDLFKISSRNANGVLGGGTSFALADIAPPTVGVQLMSRLIAASGALAEGDGGSVVFDTEVGPGTIVYPVTPQAVDVDDDEAGYDDDDLQGPNELLGLSSATLQASSAAAGLGDTETLADATGTGLFIEGTDPTLGLVITEPFEIVDAGATIASGLEAGLSNYGVRNSAVTEEGDATVLFTFKVDNAFTLESDGRSGTGMIDLTDVIRDLNAVPADADARASVLVADYFPPLMTLAFYDGSQLVFQFHEPVRYGGTIELLSCGQELDFDTIDVSLVTQSADGTTLFVDDAAVTDPASCFSEADMVYAEGGADGPYGLAQISGLTSAGSVADGDLPHGLFSYNTIEDTTDAFGVGNGNSWQRWSLTSLGMGTPYFAGANIVPSP